MVDGVTATLDNYRANAYSCVPQESVELADNPSLKDLLKFLKVPLWGYLLLAVLGAVFFWSPIFEPIFPRLNRLDEHIQSIDGSLERIEGRFDLLIPRLARASLSDAEDQANKSNAEGAIRALQDVIALISDARTRKISAEPDLFEDAVGVLNRLAASPIASGIARQVHDARVVLANYRSAIQPPPSLFGRKGIEITATRQGPEVLNLNGSQITWKGAPFGPMFAILPPEPPRLISTVIENGILAGGPRGGSQMLDNAAWRHLTFLNMRLSYSGRKRNSGRRKVRQLHL